MTIVFKEPGRNPRTMFILNELSVLQQLVGGPIEVVRLTEISDNVLAIVDELGKLKGKAPSDLYHYGDPLVGNVIICGDGGDEFTDVPEGIARVVKHFFEEVEE